MDWTAELTECSLSRFNQPRRITKIPVYFQEKYS
jgi:hypothetical protein